MSLRISILGRIWDSTLCNLLKCMISYFNSGYLIRYVVAFIIACLFWVPSFISPEVYFEANSIIGIFNININWLGEHTYVFIWIFFLLTFISALAVNQILREYDLVNMHNTASLVVFVMYTSAIPLFTSVNSFIIINLLLIPFIQNILRLSVIENPVSNIFNTSFYLGLASLLYTPLIYLILIIWIAILINRHTDLRNFLVSIAGLLIPYVFLYAWFYWNDTAIENSYILLGLLKATNLSLSIEVLTYLEIGLVVLLIFVTVISLLVVLGRMGEKSNYIRKNIAVLIYYLLSTLVILLLFSDHPDNLLLFSLPATFIVTIAVYSIYKNRFINILFSLLLVCIFLNHYYQLLNVKEVFFK